MKHEELTDLENLYAIKRLFMNANVPKEAKEAVWVMANKELEKINGK